ncbi:HSP20-like chaperone [Hyaloraphidium curvatum]|nr:HSP20-like chaperone [Hyaloraphidium curvatum]
MGHVGCVPATRLRREPRFTCDVWTALIDVFCQMAKEQAHNLVPEVLWAQRAGEVYLTINLSDVHGQKIDLDEEKLHFKGESNGKTYEVTLEFSKPVDPAESKQSITPRSCYFVLKKKEADQSWWPRLVKGAKNPFFVKTDFSRWKDEDDEDEDAKGNPFDMDFSQFSNIGGGAGAAPLGGGPPAGAMGDFDSDDEEEGKDDIPDLEPAP